MILTPRPDTYTTTRLELQRVATHVLARRRFALCGKLGLRAAPGGIATLACGPDHEVQRLSGTTLIRETTGAGAATASLDLQGATLAQAAAVAHVDLSEPFAAGHDTPPVGDPNVSLEVDPEAARVLAGWFQLGWAILDASVAELGAAANPSVVQLWPEHFDAGVDVAAGTGGRVNLGASPGDTYSEQPYLYVGPWEPDRPGDPSYWNAPFGATLGYDELLASADPIAQGRAFLLRGVELLRVASGTVA